MVSREDFEAAGLFDPEIDGESGRLELLEWLEGRGFSVAEMVAAHGRLSGEFCLTESEAETPSIFTGLAGMFSEEEAHGFVRVVGSSLARIADASVSLFLTDVEGPRRSIGHRVELEPK